MKQTGYKMRDDIRSIAVDEGMKSRRLADEKRERIQRETERRHEKHPPKTTTLSTRFVPRFWDQADSRLAIIREIRHRMERLQQDCGADSYQKELLCQRTIFIVCKLETMETCAVETGQFDTGVYCQAVNTLIGLLRSLGLERKAKKVDDLQSYVASKSRRDDR